MSKQVSAIPEDELRRILRQELAFLKREIPFLDVLYAEGFRLENYTVGHKIYEWGEGSDKKREYCLLVGTTHPWFGKSVDEIELSNLQVDRVTQVSEYLYSIHINQDYLLNGKSDSQDLYATQRLKEIEQYAVDLFSSSLEDIRKIMGENQRTMVNLHRSIYTRSKIFGDSVSLRKSPDTGKWLFCDMGKYAREVNAVYEEKFGKNNQLSLHAKRDVLRDNGRLIMINEVDASGMLSFLKYKPGVRNDQATGMRKLHQDLMSELNELSKTELGKHKSEEKELMYSLVRLRDMAVHFLPQEKRDAFYLNIKSFYPKVKIKEGTKPELLAQRCGEALSAANEFLVKVVKGEKKYEPKMVEVERDEKGKVIGTTLASLHKIALEYGFIHIPRERSSQLINFTSGPDRELYAMIIPGENGKSNYEKIITVPIKDPYTFFMPKEFAIAQRKTGGKAMTKDFGGGVKKFKEVFASYAPVKKKAVQEAVTLAGTVENKEGGQQVAPIKKGVEQMMMHFGIGMPRDDEKSFIEKALESKPALVPDGNQSRDMS